MPDLKVNELNDAPEQPAPRHGRSQPPRGLGGLAAAAAVTARRAAAAAEPRQLWRRHRLITILVIASFLPRILASLAFRPALLTADSFLYMQEAANGTLGVIRPSGYSWFLDIFRIFPHTLLAVTTAQHLLGVATAVVVYALLRYWGLPGWVPRWPRCRPCSTPARSPWSRSSCRTRCTGSSC